MKELSQKIGELTGEVNVEWIGRKMWVDFMTAPIRQTEFKIEGLREMTKLHSAWIKKNLYENSERIDYTVFHTVYTPNEGDIYNVVQVLPNTHGAEILLKKGTDHFALNVIDESRVFTQPDGTIINGIGNAKPGVTGLLLRGLVNELVFKNGLWAAVRPETVESGYA
ncbi:MAG: hypothetical protein LBH74_02495 [Nitrososphaerota archaeon]|nr:hypothetical protein [Nitrososphaerota archaeon]